MNIHVVEPYRRRGIGRRLLAAAAEMAAARGAEAIYAWQPAPAHSDAAAKWRRMGFDHSVAVEQERVPVKRGYEYLLPLYERVVAARWIPADAQVVPLRPELADQVAQLHVHYLGGWFDDVVAALRGETPVHYHPPISPVLLVDGRVMGFSLGRSYAPGIALFEATAIHPALRRAWANLWLKFAVGCACLEEGIHTVEYYTYDHHIDTRKIGRRFGGTITELVEPYRLLAPQPAGAAPPPGAPPGHTPARP